ncbi:MAG: NADH-quinone oxidoreductase subunit M [Anaerolineae bacterium]|nr:MAG: NADH-quinone oxidoreductase subunit M [Anaerolineae bacterium]
MEFNFPVLTIIWLTPIVGAVIILLIPKERFTEIRMTALAAAFIARALSLAAYFAYDKGVGGWQFEETAQWVPSLGIGYHVGADGVNLPLLALTGVVIFTGVMISWGIDDRPREFFAFLLLLTGGVFGVFMSLDLFLLFFFYELAVFPMYVLIATWGSTRKEYAAMKLTLYLLIGSIIALVGILALYFEADLGTFDVLELAKAGVSTDFQRLWFLPVFLGFGVLAGIWPFHNWSPDGHVAAPTAVSMLHAGVLMKLGAYAALRVGVQLMPEGAEHWLPYVIFLVTVNVVYGSLIAMVQRDFKYVIGFSSVSHMGLVTMGFATMNTTGMSGAALQMFSHGIMTALFFAVVGMVYDRAHTRDIPSLGGFARIMPVPAIAFIIGGLVSMGMPGLSGFVAELQIFMGLWSADNVAWYYPWIAMISATGIVVTAAYVLRVVQRVFFGELKPEFADLPGVNFLDKTALFILSGILILIGVYPKIMMSLIEVGVAPLAGLFS